MRSQGQSEKNFKKIFGQRLKAALLQAGCRGVDVAKEIGVAENTVSQWFQGKREPKQEIIRFLTERYGVNPIYLLTGEGPPLLQVDDKIRDKSIIDSYIRKKKLLKMKYFTKKPTATSWKFLNMCMNPGKSSPRLQ